MLECRENEWESGRDSGKCSTSTEKNRSMESQSSRNRPIYRTKFEPSQENRCAEKRFQTDFETAVAEVINATTA